MEMGTQDNLEALEPREGLQMYLTDRDGEVSDATLQSHGYRLDHFVEWCDANDIGDLNEITGRDVQKFKMWRKKQGIAPATLKSNLDTLRVFLRFCKSINGVADGVAESVNSPSLADEDARGTDVLLAETAEQILSHLEKYRYASIHHALVRILWEAGCRMGAARSLDLGDVHLQAQYVELEHDPESDTPLKNGKRGERKVALTTKTCTILRDYIDENRHEVTDDFGREPLFTTEYGRITRNTLRAYIYRVTRPCMHGIGCPHGREPESCEAVQSRMSASKCPDSVGPHAIRRGAITHYLAEDTPAKVVSDRMDVTQEVIDEHYDSRTEREKMEQRRDYLDGL